MQENNNNHPIEFNDEINFLQFFSILLREKWIIFYFIMFASIIGIIFSLSLSNVYTSKALLVPVNQSSGISRALGGLGGIANLGGVNRVNLSSGIEASDSAKALEKIKSLSFFENNVLTNIFLPDLMATKSWNPKTNIITYDDNIYNVETNTWINKDSNLNQETISAQKSFKVFLMNHLSINEDKKSGFITLSITHKSPHIAKQWTELVINEVNAFYRHKAKSESEKSVSYLNKEILNTGLSEIKEVLAQLLQEEIKNLTLVEANEFFVFEYIDPPAVMEKKSGPNRANICILSAFLGAMLGILFVLIRYYFFSKKLD